MAAKTGGEGTRRPFNATTKEGKRGRRLPNEANSREGEEERGERTPPSIRMVVARHPIERLFSAWKVSSYQKISQRLDTKNI